MRTLYFLFFAKSQNVDKIVTKVNEDRRARMVEDFGIDSIDFC